MELDLRVLAPTSIYLLTKPSPTFAVFSCFSRSPCQTVRYKKKDKLWGSIGAGDGGGLLGARAGGRGRLHAATGKGLSTGNLLDCI